MTQSTNTATEETAVTSDFEDLTARDTLTEILRTGAQKMLRAAIQQEVADYINDKSEIVDENGCRLVVRNGLLPEREIATGVGPVAVRQPRVRDNRPPSERETFTPGVLPKYLRKTKSIEEMSFVLCVTRTHQKKNSSPQSNATSCFDFKSGRQDLNRAIVITEHYSIRQIREVSREFCLP